MSIAIHFLQSRQASDMLFAVAILHAVSHVFSKKTTAIMKKCLQMSPKQGINRAQGGAVR